MSLGIIAPSLALGLEMKMIPGLALSKFSSVCTSNSKPRFLPYASYHSYSHGMVYSDV